MRMVLLILGLLLTNLLLAQPNEYSTQLIGVNAYVKFPAGTSLPGSQLSTSEGCASICDAAGNLLFYSNGIRVWNRNHVQMPNGFGLLSNSSTTQACIIVKKPLSSNLYYIIVAPETTSPASISFNIVDINADNGLGDVIFKNQPFLISPESTEKLTFTYHCNKRDIWILTKDKSNNIYRAWLLTSAGFSSWTFSTTPYVLGNNAADNIGCMKISSDGSKLIVCHYNANRVYLYNFNNQTGVVSNEKLLSSTFLGPYGCEFSANSQYVYIGYNNGANIHRYDVNDVNPMSTRFSIAMNIGFLVGQFQRIGNIIYIAQANTNFLDAITNANLGGVFNQNYLPTTNSVTFGLNQILYPNLNSTPIIMTN